MDRWRCVMTTCWCGAPYSGLHKHFCPVARTEPDLEYATKGTTARLVEAEAAIQRVRELKMPPVSPDAAYNSGYHAALTAVRRALDGDA